MSTTSVATVEWADVVAGYSRRRGPVLHGVSWKLGPGTHLLLGPNGAGKSTMLRTAAGAIRLRSGAVWASGVELGRDRKGYLAHVGMLPQSVTALRGLSAREQVAYTAWLGGLSRTEAWSSSSQAINAVGLGDQSDHNAATLSGGQLRRMGIAACLAHRANVLLLDEPMSGLDPDERDRLRVVVKQLASNTCVVISTHDVGDLEPMCDSVAVLTKGLVRFTGTRAAFLAGDADQDSPALAAYRRYTNDKGMDQ